MRPEQPRPCTVRFRELDALRGLAALAVVLYHLTTFMGDGPGLGGPPAVSIWWGEYGVQLFFLISGFVILLSARRTRRPSDFVISRVSRICPVYWIALTVAIALGAGLAVPGLAIPWRDRLLDYTLVQVAVVVAIFAAVTLPRRPIPLLASRPLLWRGDRSSSLYVAHLVPIMALLPILDPALGRGAAMAVLLVGALVLAVVYHRVGEVEATRWMRRALSALRDRSAHPLDRARPAGVR